MYLTTTQLAERTGIAAGTLRVWQARYGFPAATRAAGGRHRYAAGDVKAVESVARLRAEGMTMSAAIARARSASAEAPTSIYAGLCQRRPDLRPQVLRKRALLELTRAIEDEHAAHAGDGLLLGSFQQARHYRASEARWRELARPLSLAIAMADFPRARARKGSPIEVPIARADPLAREWTLIVSSPGAHACLASWELPAPQPLPDGDRRFEVVWSFDPAAVAAATRVAASLLQTLAPRVAISPFTSADGVGSEHARFASDLAARAVAYLGARLGENAG